MSMIKIESYLIIDKLRVVDDAVDKLSKTFLVKMERVFSQDNDDVDKQLPPTNKTFLIKMECADTEGVVQGLVYPEDNSFGALVPPPEVEALF